MWEHNFDLTNVREELNEKEERDFGSDSSNYSDHAILLTSESDEKEKQKEKDKDSNSEKEKEKDKEKDKEKGKGLPVLRTESSFDRESLRKERVEIEKLWSNNFEDLTSEIQETTSKLQFCLDLCFLVDITGSMDHAINAIRRKIFLIVKEIFLRIALIA
eukprot:Anaeramoba_flamelloidesc35010_g1_i1.p2 GENE.c35010_g1_i1~~c35010_g1_i1.p2  ORF type:complete len:160 (-),score=42.16 c35010_g1_i1:431-910(-)